MIVIAFFRVAIRDCNFGRFSCVHCGLIQFELEYAIILNY